MPPHLCAAGARGCGVRARAGAQEQGIPRHFVRLFLRLSPSAAIERPALLPAQARVALRAHHV